MLPLFERDGYVMVFLMTTQHQPAGPYISAGEVGHRPNISRDQDAQPPRYAAFD